MATTPIKFPGLPTGMTLTVEVTHPSTLTVEETVTLTEASGVYSGSVTGTSSGQKIFVMKASGSTFGSRIRTIEDTTATFIILSELETYASDGRGAYPVTITIDDGTDPVEGAFVQVFGTGIYGSGTTNASGIAKLALNDGDYDVTVAKVGFPSAYESLTVSGATSDTYSLTATPITESPPGTGTGWMYVYDETMEVEEGVPISIQMSAGPGDDGRGLDQKIRTETSDEDGLVEFPGMLHGATYRVWRGPAENPATSTVVQDVFFGAQTRDTSLTIVVPVAGTFPLIEVLGTDTEA